MLIRKSTASLAILGLALLASCGSVTGVQPQQSKSVTQPGPDRLCIPELRQVVITSPPEGAVVYTGQDLFIQWKLQQPCSEYTSDLSISTDHGRTFNTFAQNLPNCRSFYWHDDRMNDGDLVLQVTSRDRDGAYSAQVVLATRVDRPGPPAPRQPSTKRGHQF